MKKTFYLADDLNINKKNFKSLYDYLESKGILFSKDNNKEINKFVYGNYKTINKELIDNYIKELTKLNEIELYQLVYNNIKLFDLYKSELMSYLITPFEKSHWSLADGMNRIANPDLLYSFV